MPDRRSLAANQLPLIAGIIGVVSLLAGAGCAPAPPAPATTTPVLATAAPTAAAAPKPSAAPAAPSPAASPSAAAPAPKPAASPAASPVPSAAASPVPSPAAQAPIPVGPNGERLVEQSAEARFQLDLAVSDAALASYLPAGWTANVATTGPAKDANLRAVFIDRVTVNGPTGAPIGAGSSQLVYLVAPVRDPSGATQQLVIGGLARDPADAPGPFGNYLLATTHTMERRTTANSGPIMDSQDWVFEAASGEHLELHVTYERGNAARAPVADTRFYSAQTPTFYQLSRQEQVLDILRNVTTAPPDRVHEFSVTLTGGSYARLFDGSQRVLSWDNILWLNRMVFQP